MREWIRIHFGSNLKEDRKKLSEMRKREEKKEDKVRFLRIQDRGEDNFFIERTDAGIALITSNQTEKTFIQPIHHTRLFISHKVVFITQDNQNLISI